MANNKSKSERKIIIFSIIGLLVVAGGVASRFNKGTPPIAVAAEKVTRRNITETVVANGKIEPVLQVNMSPEVSGEIIVLNVKEGQNVNKGDLLFKIKPDNYVAARDSAKANYNSSVANRETAKANLAKADLEFKRNQALFKDNLISESDFLTAKTTDDVAKSTLDGAAEQISIAKAQLDSAEADLSKTTVYSPLTGTVSKLNSELGERVVGTAQMAGTEIMTVADLHNMEARVDIGEIDVPLIKLAQKASLEVDSFKDQKFNGVVTLIADSANNNDTSSAAATAASTTSTEATKFQVRILLSEKERFLPGMSVTANIETRYRSNVLTVPIQSVTTRIPTNGLPGAATNAVGTNTMATNSASTNSAAKKADEPPKPIEVVFVVDGDHVKEVPVKRGISDDNYVEIVDGLKEGQQVVSGGYKAINRDLEDGKKVEVNAAAAGQDKDKEKKSY
ncbi:MAG TPA: efflux RND transporter periplasmic adaptor subunit [Verrucomicrobiae bacterium]|jgi:HlyD family secretion protein